MRPIDILCIYYMYTYVYYIYTYLHGHLSVSNVDIQISTFGLMSVWHIYICQIYICWREETESEREGEREW